MLELTSSAPIRELEHLDAVVIGTASIEEKLRTVRALGADHAVNYAERDFSMLCSTEPEAGVSTVQIAVRYFDDREEPAQAVIQTGSTKDARACDRLE